jgi:hypothetical protein
MDRWTISALEEKGKNNFYMNVISYSDGPALRINEKLEKGQTNQCNTFGSPILTMGQKNIDDMFEIYNFEVFIL